MSAPPWLAHLAAERLATLQIERLDTSVVRFSLVDHGLPAAALVALIALIAACL